MPNIPIVNIILLFLQITEVNVLGVNANKKQVNRKMLMKNKDFNIFFLSSLISISFFITQI